MRYLQRILLLGLSALIPAVAQAQPLDGVLVSTSGGDVFRNGIALFNPSVSATNRVTVTPHFDGSSWARIDLGSGTFSGSATMAPTGRTAFLATWTTENRLPRVFVQERDATGRVQVTDTTQTGEHTAWPEAQDQWPAISPDGQSVAFISNRFRELSGGSPLATDFNVFTVPAGGGTLNKLTSREFHGVNQNNNCAGISRVVWSPDGSQLAFVGLRVVDRGANPSVVCAPVIATMSAGGGEITILRSSRNPDGTPTGFAPTGFVLDWTEGGILYWDSNLGATVIDGPSLDIPSILDPAYTFRVDEGAALSPDGAHLAVRLRHNASGALYAAVLDWDGNIVAELTEASQGGPGFVDWVDAPPVPAADRLELANTYGLVWGGQVLEVQPTLYDAGGNVIVVGARDWTNAFVNVNTPRGDLVEGVLFGNASPTNTLDWELCATNGGLEACARVNNVHVPIITPELVDGDMEEDGRNPGVIRVSRYGNPEADLFVNVNWGGVATARLYQDYTVNASGDVIPFIESDTLETVEFTLVPIDDGIAEGNEFARLDVDNGSGYVLSAQPGTVDITLIDNGAGSGTGISLFSPATGLQGATVIGTLHGQHFDESTTVALVGPATIEGEDPTPVEDTGGTVMHALFDLTAAPVGRYDVVVTGSETSTLANAFEVTAEGVGPDLWARVVPQPFRLGLPARQEIIFGNRGDTDAFLAPMIITLPRNVEVAFFSEPGLPTEEELPDGFPLEILEPYNHPDSLFFDTVDYIPELVLPDGSTVGGDTMAVKRAAFFLPVLPAGYVGRVFIDVTVPTSDPVPIGVVIEAPYSYAGYPFVEGFGARGSECSDPSMLSSESLAGFSPADCVLCANALFGVGIAFLSALPGGTCARGTVIGLVNAARGTYSIFVGALSQRFAPIWRGGIGIGTAFVGAVAACVGEVVFPIGLVQKGIIIAGAFSSSATAKDACPDCFDDPYYNLIPELEVRDPNEKYGPLGVGQQGYVAAFGPSAYEIAFENLPTANAAVVELTVTDTLDTTAFDLSTFQIGSIVLPDTTLTPPLGLASWTTRIDVPEREALIQADVHLDTETGIVRWLISELDPVTFALRTGPDAGFLPPNGMNGEGEGGVRFLIEPLADLPSGTRIENRAGIRFDRQEVIQTGTWINTLDQVPPVSQAIFAGPADTDSSYVVRWMASDSEAGVARTVLYASADEGPFEAVFATADTAAVFVGRPGVRYGFYTIAADLVGNREGPKTKAEVFSDGTVDAEDEATGLPAEVTLEAPYPNPTAGAVMFRIGLPRATRTRFRVYDLRGRLVARLDDVERRAGWHMLSWDTRTLAAGVYIARLEAGSARTTRRFTVVR